MIRVVDWFAGVGGFTLGLEMAGGFKTVAFSEVDPYASKILQKHWPGTTNLGDINHVRPEDIPRADLWTGGIPCQPFSVAGKRHGAADERHLWPAFYSLLRVVRPRYVLVENVPGLLADRAFLDILGDLSTCGYDAEWSVIPACAFGAPHRRARLFLWASMEHADCTRLERLHDTIGGVDREPAPTALPRHDWSPPPRVSRAGNGVPHRVDRLRCLGNAVVPQVVEWIGKRVKERINATG